MLSDEQATEIGNKLIKLLALHVKPNGRVDTDGGDKTPAGLARTVKRIFHEARYEIGEPISESRKSAT
jgi:hypothetical protein|tara:strand:+ start:532 stop:735 length:204 start_codon:yes stop_codon:yes gene_type:complete